MIEKTEQPLTDEHKRIISQALWDLNLSPEEFVGIIRGSAARKWPDRGFCGARLLESVNWFRITEIFEPRFICSLWTEARGLVRLKTIKEGMDFACRLLQ